MRLRRPALALWRPAAPLGASPCALSAAHAAHAVYTVNADRAMHSAQIAHVDHMRPEKLGQAELCEEVDVS